LLPNVVDLLDGSRTRIAIFIRVPALSVLADSVQKKVNL